MPVTGREGPQGCEMLRIPHCLENRTDGGEVVSLTHRPLSTPYERFIRINLEWTIWMKG
jgi:hypothetical protein